MITPPKPLGNHSIPPIFLLSVHIHREVPNHPQDGSDDYMEHDQFIEPPSTELQSFNGHILMSIPHFKEQLAVEPEDGSGLRNKTSKVDGNS